MSRKLIILVALMLPAAALSSVRAGELAYIDDLDFGDVESQVFTLEREETISVRAVAFRHHEDCDAWILDRVTREVVWELDDARITDRHSKTVELEDDVELPAGTYELYFAVASDYGWEETHFFGLIRTISRTARYGWGYRKALRELEVGLSAPGGRNEGRNDAGQVRDVLRKDAIVAFTGVGDDELLRGSFALERPMEVEVYALGEAERRETYDGGWIEDVDRGERVWELDYRHSRGAGGAKKNRMTRETLRLVAGTYAVFYASDDSHSWPRFNQRPPRDPMAWGVTIRPVDPADAAHVSTFDYEDPLDRNVIVSLVRMRDDEHASGGFTLDAPLDIRIVAIGEGDDGRMYDHGWIVDARTREIVWEMDLRDTRHAGGDEKNRMIDEVRRFDAGSYIVHYVTDGSHSYRDWNASAPFLRDRWGITLVGVGDTDIGDRVRGYDVEDDPAVLARIDRMRNHDHDRASFHLDRGRDVLVYALGEGQRGRMFDYGWIEDDRGRIVWEMTYRRTDHAGGARKNRLFRDQVYLEAGEYELHYETDGSHAYRRWNAEPPLDPPSWGITVYRVD